MTKEIDISMVLLKAAAAAEIAVEGCSVKPMVVTEDRPNGQSWTVPDGVCGFAWVNVYGLRKNSKLAKSMMDFGFRHSSYERSLMLWVYNYNQSMTKKEVYATEFAKVLREAGLRAYPGSRMD